MEGAIVIDHPHIEVFRRTYAAFTKGDMKALAEVFAEDVIWHTRAETCSPEATRAATQPWRASRRSSSCRAEPTRSRSMTCWPTTTTPLPASLHRTARRQDTRHEVRPRPPHRRREDHGELGTLPRHSPETASRSGSVPGTSSSSKMAE